MTHTKGGLELLADFYREAGDETLARATVEDVALLLALRRSYPPDSDEANDLAFVPECAARWLELVNAPGGPPPEEVRLQPVLRRILQKVTAEGNHTIEAEEIVVLKQAHDLINEVTAPGRYDRLRHLLDTHAANLRETAAGLLQPGLLSLAETFAVATPETLRAAPRREISSFAGLAILSRGPVYQAQGDLKVLDEIPDACTVVVEDGSCLVNGHCQGRVAATLDCEVRGNLAGTVVVANGSVWVGACLSKCTALSKNGSVVTRRCEDPELVFAGDQILVLGDTRGGVYLAPSIEIRGVAQGGAYHISRLLTAETFSALAGNEVIIEMQRKISFFQVGELIEEAAARLLSRLALIRRTIRNTEALLSVAAQECDHYANSALTYLVGGDEKREQLEDLHRAQRRLAFLNRIVAGIDVLTQTAEDGLIGGKRDKDSALARDNAGSLHEMQQELAAYDTDADADLASVRDELKALASRLPGLGAAPSGVLTRLREKKLAWLLERKTLQSRIDELETAVRDSGEQARAFDQQLKQASRVQVLTNVLKKLRSRPVADPLRERARAPFIQIILKTIDTRRNRMKMYQAGLERLSREYEEGSDKLIRLYHVTPPGLDDAGEGTPTVTGCFGDGVTLCTERCFLDEPDAPAHSVIRAGDSGGNKRTYRREEDRIVQVATE